MGHTLTLLLCVVTKQVGESEKKDGENVLHISNLGRVCSGGKRATDDHPSHVIRNRNLGTLLYGVRGSVSSHSDTVIVHVLRIFKLSTPYNGLRTEDVLLLSAKFQGLA